MNGGCVLNSTTDRPNGRQITTAARKPATPAVRIRIGRPVRAGWPPPPSGHRARRIVTTATRGIRIPSCGLMIVATTARIAARSGRSRHSSRNPSSMKTTPTESTWPQTTLSNQEIGLKTATAAPTNASRRRPPSSRIIEWTSQPIARSARIGTTLRPNASRNGKVATQVSAWRAESSQPMSQSVYR